MQPRTDRIRRCEFHRRPVHRVEALFAAVEMIVAIVFAQHELMPVQRETSVCNAVCMATDQRADIESIPLILRNCIEAEHDVAQHAVPIGNADRANDAAIRQKLDLDSVRVAQGDHVDPMSLRIDTKQRATHGAHRGDRGTGHCCVQTFLCALVDVERRLSMRVAVIACDSPGGVSTDGIDNNAATGQRSALRRI